MPDSSAPRRIVFVCTGNICRSAMAEHLLRHWSKERGLGLEIRSCGIAAEGWYEVPEHARRLLAAAGVPPFEHRPQLLTREQLRWADAVLVMAEHHRDHICELYPEFTGKTRLLRAAAGFGDLDVSDPMGKPYEVFAECLAVIRQSLEALLSREWRSPA
ncbi:MAG: low molecular weight protein arginine phosphatase [Elusimicrobia bacterium]|nr:low molecular weight protein arginine phosphatase [Elusimicrobiota bacterium]